MRAALLILVALAAGCGVKGDPVRPAEAAAAAEGAPRGHETPFPGDAIKE